MSIQIRNYDTSKAKGFFKGTFDLYIQTWGATICGCKHFIKDEKKWFTFPEKGVKNPDDTWGKPIPYIILDSEDRLKKLQSVVMPELNKIQQPPAENEVPF